MQAVIRLYREARRRKVFRTAALYVVGAWALLQAAALSFPGFGIAEAAIRAAIWAAVLGFPVALVFGWLFEVGPEGIRRTRPVASGEAAEPRPLARRDYLLLAAFAAIAAVLVYRAAEHVRELPKADARASTERDAAPRLENSIAVLPFANVSDDAANEYFADGVAEEILDRLAKFSGLNVIGRTSSFAFKGSNYGIDRISALLGVRYVLQGSVRKAGDQLRISAQLLDEGGRQVWSESFDRQLRNVFEIQSEIADAVATTVASQVVPKPKTGHQPDLAAYQHYLQGRTRMQRRDVLRAREDLRRAVELDPQFAEAYAELAIADTFMEDLDSARRALDRALELRPQLLRARAAEGFLLMQGRPRDLAGSERVLREVIAEDPNMSDALLWLQNNLREQGRDAEARSILERAALIDPLHPSIAVNLASALLREGKVEEAKRIFRRQIEQPEPSPLMFTAAHYSYWSSGELVEAHALVKAQVLADASGPALRGLPLALSYAALGDWPQSEAWLNRDLKDPPAALAQLFRDVALPAWQGQTELAAQRMRTALDDWQRKHGPLNPIQQQLAGVHLARGGAYMDAIELLEPVVDANSPGSSAFGIPSFLHAAHALAWAYRHTGAEDKARPLLEAEARECAAARVRPERRRDSYARHRCAETELLLGHTDQALDGLEQAIRDGWREYYLRQNDPYWSAVAAHPRYRALMAQVKADVDRQRAEVRRIDAQDDFAAKLDAAIAAETNAGGAARAASPE